MTSRPVCKGGALTCSPGDEDRSSGGHQRFFFTFSSINPTNMSITSGILKGGTVEEHDAVNQPVV